MRRRRTHLLVIVGVLASALVGMAPSQAVCAKPAAPALKAVWSASGGPRITLSPGPGALPRSVSWAVAYRSDTTWSSWSKWTTRTVRARAAAVVHSPKLHPARARAAYSAYAESACGRSKSATLEIPLATASQLVTNRPAVARSLPQALGAVAVADLLVNPYDMPLSVSSRTPGVCAPNAARDRVVLIDAGMCQLVVSQRSARVSTPNPDVVLDLEVLAADSPLPATAVDRPDDLQGFQIHVVYVTLADAPGHGQQQSGLLDTWVALSQRWLQATIGRQLRFDTHQGQLDVSVLASRHSMAELSPSADEASGTQGLELLRAEYLAAQEGAGMRGKNLLFMVDAPISADYCGWADTPGDLALVTTAGEGCWTGTGDFAGQGHGLNWVSLTIIHELLHNMGVNHTCVDATDIMLGGTCRTERADEPATLDAGRVLYVGASAAGADILGLKVWADGSGERHLPQPGTCYVGESCALPRTFWSGGAQILELQRQTGTTWQTVSTFSSRRLAEGGAYPYTYDVTWMPTGSGSVTLRYRLQPNAEWLEYLGEPFTVVVPY